MAVATEQEGYETPTRGDSIAEQVYRQLSNAVLSGAFAPLERINLRRLASEIGVSVTPVRESVLRLISDGVLQTTETNAIYVPELQEPEITEIFQIRKHLEGELAAAAAPLLNDEDIDFLTVTQGRFLSALAEQNFREVLRMNALFHFHIYRKPTSPIRLRMVEGLWLRIGPTLHRMYPILEQDRARHRSHEAIIDYCRERNPAALMKGIVADLNFSEGALLQYLAQSQSRPVRRPRRAS